MIISQETRKRKTTVTGLLEADYVLGEDRPRLNKDPVCSD